MFEFSLAIKYLLPKRKQLSVTLISCMAIIVISVIVWLFLVFLSVTEGLERSWLSKLTNLNSPIRINPTENYFTSYYYKIDNYAQSSHFQTKSLGEKLIADKSDPFDPENDMDVHNILPSADRKSNGELKDPVKSCFAILKKLQNEYAGFCFQEYEVGGASLRIELNRLNQNGQPVQSYLNQVSYVATFADQSPFQKSLIQNFTAKDMDELLKEAVNKPLDIPYSLDTINDEINIKTVLTTPYKWKLRSDLLPQGFKLDAIGYQDQDGYINNIVLYDSKEEAKKLLSYSFAKKGILSKEKDGLYFQLDKAKIALKNPHITTSFPLSLEIHNQRIHTETSKLYLEVSSKLNGFSINGVIPYHFLNIGSFESKKGQNIALAVKSLFPSSTKSYGLIVPKSFCEKGAKVGDRGHISYGSLSASSVQEQKLPVFIAGFYDPGIIAIGNNFLLASKDLAHRLSAQTSSYAIERGQANGIQIWFSDLGLTKEIYTKLKAEMQKEGIDNYFAITPFYEYDFAKDVLEQFNSDKVLFTIVGIIILTVACCNIISLLNLLVNDKKKEIAILQAIGASKKSIILVFSLCGLCLGLLSSLLGVILSYLTLHNINSIVQFLTWVQGYNPFNALFYGNSLPNSLSIAAVSKVMIFTPLLAFVAGLVPALKAMKIAPSSTLRSE